jgi:hypothetical protein
MKRYCVALMLALASSGAALAQTQIVMPGAAQRCLTTGGPTLDRPDYPKQAYEHKAGAKVELEIEFRAPNAAPKVRSLKTEADARYRDDFESAVLKVAERYRVPCLPAGETATLKQEFVFVPHDGRPVSWMAQTDEESQRSSKLNRCLTKPTILPVYPERALRADRQGTVLVALTFTGSASPPQVAVLDDGGDRAFAEAVQDHAGGVRMPCHDNAGAVQSLMLYDFKFDGGSRVVLNDMTMITLLRHLKGIRSANLYFDFNQMGCPFEGRLEYFQPHAPNLVGEVGPRNPERRFFLDWLSRQQLDLPTARQANAVLGQRTVISVPCTVLDLGARAGGGGGT